MVRNIFIKPIVPIKKHFFLKNNSSNNNSILIMYNPHLIYKDNGSDNGLLYGFLILLNKNMTIPNTFNINNNLDIMEYIKKNYRLDYIKSINKETYIIDNTKYDIYYINCNSKYYSSIYDTYSTEMIWKDNYFISNMDNNNIYKVKYVIDNFVIYNNEILEKIINYSLMNE
jgi:hypothetical protein